MENKIEFDQVRDAVYENPDIPKYFFVESGWYVLSTKGDCIYKLKDGDQYQLDEKGEPLGYLEKLQIRP